MTKNEAQKAITDAALTIGPDGNKDFVFALSNIDYNESQIKASIAVAGDHKVIVNGLVSAMEADTDFKKIMIAAVNSYATLKFFGRSTKQCNCPKCQAERKAAAEN